MSKPKKKKSLIFTILRNLILIVSICGLLYSSYEIFTVYDEYQEGEQQYSDISTNFTQEVQTKDYQSPYPEYKTIDFKELKDINEEVVAWITIPDTNIDYPIAHGKTNNSYIHTDIYGKYLYVGTIFVDANNKPNFEDYNTIIYGHNMKDMSMFGMLRYYITKENYYDTHKYVQIYTPDRKANYKIIGYQVTYSTSDHYQKIFNFQSDYENWLEEMTKNSYVEVAPYDPNKKTITISTCYGVSGSSQRLVFHLQRETSVSTNVYSQFIIEENKGGQENAILCYCPWLTHRDFH